MDSRKEKVEKLRQVLLRGDLSSDEYSTYLAIEEKAVNELLSRPELDSKFNTNYHTFIQKARSYYLHFSSVLALSTFKKLKPDFRRNEMNDMCFVAWLIEMIIALTFVIDDIGDGYDIRALKPSIPALLGLSSTVSLTVAIQNTLFDMADEKLSKKSYHASVVSILRSRFNGIVFSIMIDASAQTYNRRFDMHWQHKQEYASSIGPAYVLPIELAFAVAQKPATSRVATLMMELANNQGSLGRMIDDIVDLEVDTKNRSFNWGFSAAWYQATHDQRIILLKHMNQPDDMSIKAVMELYDELGIISEYNDRRRKLKENFNHLLEQCGEETPKRTWRACCQFLEEIYGSVAGY